MWLGISLLIGVWWVTLIFVLIFWIYYERIMFAEDEFLRVKFGRKFEEWANRTPSFLPSFKNRRPSDQQFSLKKVLKDEYSSLFAAVASFTFLEIFGDMIAEKTLKIGLGLGWIIFFLTGLTVYLTLKILKKKTHFLKGEK